jgi:hypothetical protein
VGDPGDGGEAVSDLVPALSPSIAHILDSESPLHAWTAHRLLGNKPRPPTDAQEKGKLIHALLFDDHDTLAVVEADSFRTNEAKAARDSARKTGLTPVLRPKLDEAQAIAARLRERIEGFGYDLAKGHPEHRVEWTERAPDGASIACHGRLDFLCADRPLVLDLKTTEGSAHPSACTAKLLNTAGVIQDTAYRHAVTYLDPSMAGRVEMVFLFAQVVEPYAVTPIICGGTMREIGFGRWSRAVAAWARCLRTDQWPSYATYPVQVEAPAWMLARNMMED